MTTQIVPTVTDELIAGLEEAADYAANQVIRSHGWEGTVDEFADGMLGADERYMRRAEPATILALLAHIADLKQQLAAASVDADRYRWLRDTAPSLVIAGPLIAMCGPDGSVMRREHGSEMLLSCEKADAAIDAARNLATD